MQRFSTHMWEDCEEVTLHMDTPSLKVSSERKEKKKILVSAKELSKCRSFPNQNDTSHSQTVLFEITRAT